VFLAALPPDIQEKVVSQQRQKHQRQNDPDKVKPPAAKSFQKRNKSHADATLEHMKVKLSATKTSSKPKEDAESKQVIKDNTKLRKVLLVDPIKINSYLYFQVNEIVLQSSYTSPIGQ
jgi:hypothetical protein